MPTLPRFLLTLTAVILLVPAARADAWPAALDASLARAGIPRSATAVLVQDVDGGAPLAAHRTREAMNPASVMKLVTSYVALDRLGPAFTIDGIKTGLAQQNKGRFGGIVRQVARQKMQPERGLVMVAPAVAVFRTVKDGGAGVKHQEPQCLPVWQQKRNLIGAGRVQTLDVAGRISIGHQIARQIRPKKIREIADLSADGALR